MNAAGHANSDMNQDYTLVDLSAKYLEKPVHKAHAAIAEFSGGSRKRQLPLRVPIFCPANSLTQLQPICPPRNALQNFSQARILNGPISPTADQNGASNRPEWARFLNELQPEVPDEIRTLLKELSLNGGVEKTRTSDLFRFKGKLSITYRHVSSVSSDLRLPDLDSIWTPGAISCWVWTPCGLRRMAVHLQQIGSTCECPFHTC
jgi:hypothetical protein